MIFKIFKKRKLAGEYSEIHYCDTTFYKKYVETDKWWNKEYLPDNHKYYDFQLFINQLSIYSKEHGNPLAAQYEISIKAKNLKIPTFVLSHEDFTEVKSLDELVEILTEVMDYYKNNYNCTCFVCNVEIACIQIKKSKSSRKRKYIPRGLRHEVFKRDNYTCQECGAKKEDGATLHIDHIIPISKGGSDELNNLQTLCSDCNLNKSDIIQEGVNKS